MKQRKEKKSFEEENQVTSKDYTSKLSPIDENFEAELSVADLSVFPDSELLDEEL